jgi:Rrf2 family protein
MSRDTRLSTAIHILMVLFGAKDKLTQSDYIAGSVNTNPVIIRRLLGMLKEAGIIEVVAGKNGGSKLLKSAEDITVWDVFIAVQNTDLFFQNSNEPNKKCPVGQKINLCLNDFYAEVHETIEGKLKSETILSLYNDRVSI